MSCSDKKVRCSMSFPTELNVRLEDEWQMLENIRLNYPKCFVHFFTIKRGVDWIENFSIISSFNDWKPRYIYLSIFTCRKVNMSLLFSVQHR